MVIANYHFTFFNLLTIQEKAFGQKVRNVVRERLNYNSLETFVRVLNLFHNSMWLRHRLCKAI